MKLLAELLLLRESEIDTQDVFIHMEHSINTFGEFMKKFKWLDDVVKTIAMDHEWSSETFTKLKAAQIPEKYLKCEMSKIKASSEFVNLKVPGVMAMFTSVDEEVGFQADSMFHEPIIIHIPNDKSSAAPYKPDYFVIDVNGSKTAYEHHASQHEAIRVIGKFYQKVNANKFANEVKAKGLTHVLDNDFQFSEINMLAVFSDEV